MLYNPLSSEGKDFIETIEENQKTLFSLDKKAKEKNQLVGRYIKEPYADGYAIYQIIRENKSSVRVRVCTGLGDDWAIPYWGNEATIDKNYAEGNILRRDRMSELFKKREEA